uniref:t-SNARE coiled-coil homology domain-containing protein n=1 Tax=Spongospora subterranea TaxID=70186 RepID=A0A0H5QJQ7_9EUKA|eukprot:CRZ01862.1 hypothetical protein [Spongospora subterranea]
MDSSLDRITAVALIVSIVHPMIEGLSTGTDLAIAPIRDQIDSLLRHGRDDGDKLLVSLQGLLDNIRHGTAVVESVQRYTQRLSDLCQVVGDSLKSCPDGPDRTKVLQLWRAQVRLVRDMESRLGKLFLESPTPLIVNGGPYQEQVVVLNVDVEMDVKPRMDAIDDLNAVVVDVESDRNAMVKINQDASDLAEMYQDLRHLATRQGDILNEIEMNAVKSAANVKKGVVEVEKAAERTGRQRSSSCCFLSILVAVIAIIIVGIIWRNDIQSIFVK